MKSTKKCNCGANSKIFCKNCSKIKMVILLKSGNNHLKLKGSNGRNYNPSWYSHLSKNNKPTTAITSGMLRRFHKSNYANCTNKVQFYNNITKTLIEEHRF